MSAAPVIGSPVDSARYPALSSIRYWEWGRQHIEFRTFTDFPIELLGAVNVVAFEDERVILARLNRQGWEVPGGTVEVGEEAIDTARRELLEEAGARLDEFTVIGGWLSRTEETQPYRPHLPHPVTLRVVGVAEARRVGPPTGGEGAEHVEQVRVFDLAEAVEILVREGSGEIADLLRLASDYRNVTSA